MSLPTCLLRNLKLRLMPQAAAALYPTPGLQVFGARQNTRLVSFTQQAPQMLADTQQCVRQGQPELTLRRLARFMSMCSPRVEMVCELPRKPLLVTPYVKVFEGKRF